MNYALTGAWMAESNAAGMVLVYRLLFGLMRGSGCLATVAGLVALCHLIPAFQAFS